MEYGEGKRKVGGLFEPANSSSMSFWQIAARREGC